MTVVFAWGIRDSPLQALFYLPLSDSFLSKRLKSENIKQFNNVVFFSVVQHNYNSNGTSFVFLIGSG